MKREIYSKISKLMVLVMLTSFMSVSEASNGKRYLTDWTMSSAGKSYSVQVPTTVMGALSRYGLYDGVLEGENIKRVDGSPFAKPWIFTTEFKVNKSSNGRVLLRFYGVSHSANVTLNGEKVADKNNMFGTFRIFTYDVTDKVKADNQLSVEVFHAKRGEFNTGYVDWNPQPADSSMGLYRPVELIVTDGPVQIASSSVHSRTILSDPNHESWLTLDAQLFNHSDKVVKGVLKGQIDSVDGSPSADGFSFPVTLAPGEQRTFLLTSAEAACLHLQTARLWKLNVEMKDGQRNVPYRMHLQFVETDGTIDDASDQPFYIRQVKTSRTSGDALAFAINGQNTLIRAGGWTDDIFMRDSAESISNQLDYVEAMHLNTIRLEGFWGNSDEIYRQCDERGILILVGWSCHWEWDEYLGKPIDDKYGGVASSDVDLIAASFRDQVTWLRVHPSIIGWFVGSDKMPLPELEQRYISILHELDDRDYILSAQNVTSKISGTSGMKMYGPYEYVGPSYWYTDTKLGGAYGFNTETGIGAQLPQMESLVRFIPKEQLWPVNGSAWKLHCTRSGAGMHSLDVLTDIIHHTFGSADNLQDYLHKADFLNYQSTQAMFEAFRVNVPVATGIVQWMLNSAWPSLYWQLYDWYGVPTAAYYATRHANEPVQAVYDYKDHSVRVVNSTTSKAVVSLSVKRYDEASKLILTDSVASLSVEPNGSAKALAIEPTGKLSYLFLAVKTIDGSRVASNDYILSGTDEEDNTAKSTWFYTPIKRYATLTELNALQPAKVEMSSIKRATSVNGRRTIDVTLSNRSSVISFFNRLVLKDKQGRIIAPALWSDNYVMLQPGETRHLTVSVREDVKNMTLSVEGWNSKVAAKAVK